MQKFDLLKKNNSLINYYYYSNYFTNEDIEKIINISKKYDSVDGNVSGAVDYDYRKSKITWLPLNDETNFMYEKIVFLCKDANDKMWNFNITNLVDTLQLAEYTDGEEQGHYDWHMDIGTGDGNCTRKISVSIQLSDESDYEGGDLEFMIHRSIIKAPRQKGSVIFFPSYITHKVNKVTKGNRKSLVLWFHGPPFV